jgi:hypothetical protein
MPDLLHMLVLRINIAVCTAAKWLAGADKQTPSYRGVNALIVECVLEVSFVALF